MTIALKLKEKNKKKGLRNFIEHLVYIEKWDEFNERKCWGVTSLDFLTCNHYVFLYN